MGQITKQMADHLRQVIFGGNWTTSSYQQHFTGMSLEAASLQQEGNSILTLFCHATYYIPVLKKVLVGGPLTGNDKESFTLPVLNGQADWEALQQRTWEDAEKTAELLGLLPDEKLTEPFTDPKYGSYYRNISGIIEHLHYHLGQVVLLKLRMEQ